MAFPTSRNFQNILISLFFLIGFELHSLLVKKFGYSIIRLPPQDFQHSHLLTVLVMNNQHVKTS